MGASGVPWCMYSSCIKHTSYISLRESKDEVDTQTRILLKTTLFKLAILQERVSEKDERSVKEHCW
jgi:hypothetical protein